MSGSSGSNFTTGGIGGPDSCAGLRFERELQIPNPSVVAGLSVGVILAVVLNAGPPPTISIVTSTGMIAGAIVPNGQLIDCLRLAVPFEAEVKSKVGVTVLLDVRAA